MIKPEYATYRYTKKSCGAPFYTIRLMHRLPLFRCGRFAELSQTEIFYRKKQINGCKNLIFVVKSNNEENFT